MSYHYPAFTADIIVLNADRSKLLLITRKNPPYANKLAFPGGFMEADETLKICAIRELWEETQVRVEQEQVSFYMLLDEVDRDPRGRVISAVFVVLLHQEQEEKLKPKADDDALRVSWYSVQEALHKGMAFDHEVCVSKLLSEGILKADLP